MSTERETSRVDRTAASSKPGAPAAKGTVLVVDDDVDMLRLLRKWLEDDGFRVVEAASGAPRCTSTSGRRPTW